MNFKFKPHPDAIYTVLGVSTGNIPQHTAEALGLEDGELAMRLSYESYEYGWLIWTANDLDSPILDMHPELRDLLLFANQQGHLMLRLDCDEDHLSGAPTFDW